MKERRQDGSGAGSSHGLRCSNCWIPRSDRQLRPLVRLWKRSCRTGGMQTERSFEAYASAMLHA